MLRRSMLLVALVYALAAAGLGCGGGGDDTPPSIDTFFPADNAVGDWVEDTTVGTAGVEVATTPDEAWALINGDNEPFHAHEFVEFARQHYMSGTYKLEARVWDMGTAAVAEGLYDALPTEAALYGAQTWEALTLGDQSRIADTGASWWVNARKGLYHVETKINQATASDSISRGHAQTFAEEMLSRIP